MKNFSLVEVYGADESFLTGTFGAQVPVGLVDGRPIGNGVAGDITKRIRSAYFDLIEKNTKLKVEGKCKRYLLILIDF